jgi:hypothetical protein
VDNYKDNALVNHDGTWLSGIKDAKFGSSFHFPFRDMKLVGYHRMHYTGYVSIGDNL